MSVVYSVKIKTSDTTQKHVTYYKLKAAQDSSFLLRSTA